VTETLVVSALPGEQAVLRRALGVRRRGLASDGAGLYVLATGDGARRAEGRLSEALDRVKVDRVVVVGLGGGLSPCVRAETLYTGDRVVEPDGRAHPLEPWPGLGTATLVSTPQIVPSAGAKAALWTACGRPEPALVDLESAAFARVAHGRRLRISVVRWVSDGPEQTLPAVLERASRPDGSISPLGVALRAAVHPNQWAALARLERGLRRGAQALSDATAPALKTAARARAAQPALESTHRG